jgi:cytoskeletal protein RodZ
LRGGKKVVERLSSWSLLGAFLAALVGFGAFMYGGFDTSSANQAGVGDYEIPALDAAQLKQPSEEPPQSTKNSSSSTEAAEYTLSAEDTPPISNDSGSTEPSTGSAMPTETPSSGAPLRTSEASVPPLPVQAAGIPTPADSCTSQDWCANPAYQIPSQGNVPTENALSCTGDGGEDSCSKKKPDKKKPKPEQGEEGQRGD